jgi:GNAT superfamily N-acetyltransferase
MSAPIQSASHDKAQPADSSPSSAGLNVWVRFGVTYFLVRLLQVGDAHALQEFFYSHNDETIRLRYGYPRKWMSDESAYKLVAVDQDKDPALGIFEEQEGRQKLRAIGRYYLDEDGKRSEIAFVVHEDTRNIGMAGYLIAKLAEIAKQRGVEEFWASVLPDNRTMAGLFVAVGGKESKASMDDDRTFVIRVDDILRSRKKFLEEKRIETIIQ